MILCFISYAEITNNRQVASTYMRVVTLVNNVTGGNVMNTRTNNAPATNSTAGYCHEILLLHFLHAPLCARKLNTGTSSIHVRVLPQDMHFDRPPMPVPVLNLSETTFKKLPMIVPKMNERMSERVSMGSISDRCNSQQKNLYCCIRLVPIHLVRSLYLDLQDSLVIHY